VTVTAAVVLVRHLGSSEEFTSYFSHRRSGLCAVNRGSDVLTVHPSDEYIDRRHLDVSFE
jgi:hypothetical protein